MATIGPPIGGCLGERDTAKDRKARNRATPGREPGRLNTEHLDQRRDTADLSRRVEPRSAACPSRSNAPTGANPAGARKPCREPRGVER
jgi:hypothetical protein